MWYAFEFLAMFAILVTIVTQVFVPIAMGTPTFPSLRRRAIDAKLAEAREAAELEELNQLLREIEAQVNASKAKREQEASAQEAQPKDE